MKSVLGMIVVLIGLYIVIYFDIFGFFAQKWFLIVSISAAAIMLGIAAAVFGLPFKRKRGGKDEKNIHLD